MAFNIETFRSNGLAPAGDFYRSNLFHAEITGHGFDNNFTFLCKAAQLPASTVEAIEVPYQNRIVKLAGDRTFDDWTITVLNDQDFKYRGLFEAWMNDINTHIDSLSQAPAEYKTTMAITPYTRDDTAIGSYFFHGAFPTNVEAIDVAWESGAQANEYSVTIAYDYWDAAS